MRNLSTRFLLPLLTIPRETCKNSPILIKLLACLYKDDDIILIYKDGIETNEIDSIIRSMSIVPTVELYQGLAIFYCHTTGLLRRDLDLFKLGKYSSISDSGKDRILSFWKIPHIHMVYGILHKTQFARDYWMDKMGKEFVAQIDSKGLDYWSKPDEKREEFNMEFIDSYLSRNHH